MKPDFHRARRKATSLVQTLRRDIAALRHNLDFLDAFLLKPANRVRHQVSSQAFSACRFAHTDQTDLPYS